MGTFFKGTSNEFDTWVTISQPFTEDPAYILRRYYLLIYYFLDITLKKWKSAVKSADELNLSESEFRTNVINTGIECSLFD